MTIIIVGYLPYYETGNTSDFIHEEEGLKEEASKAVCMANEWQSNGEAK